MVEKRRGGAVAGRPLSVTKQAPPHFVGPLPFRYVEGKGMAVKAEEDRSWL